MPEICSPATIFDLAELGNAQTQLHWAVMREMGRGGLTYALRHEGELLGLFGIYPANDERTLGECWFNIRRQAAPFMPFLIRHIRLTMKAAPYPDLVVICGTDEGRRIARLSGFQFFETSIRGDIYHYGRYIRELGAEADGSAAAQIPG